DDGWVVGEDAVRLSLQSSIPVWWDLKRRVGEGFRVLCDGRARAAEDILVPLLGALREDAEVFLGRFVSSCVLAVPACFTLAQREVMARAARDAGMREARIVNEPTAAALSFGREGRFLILDFGAGTVDISVVESEGGVWQVLESVGSAGIGGYDFDLALAEWLRERLRLDPMPSEDPRWRMLVLEAETVKIALSSCQSYQWTPPVLDGRDFPPLRVEREDFERMARFSIRRVMHAVRRLWERHEPERLLLVGGSSRIPLLRQILEDEIARPERLSLCAEESVAAGAALYARMGEERLLLDVLSGDVGFLRDGEPKVLISSGTPLPFTACAHFVPERAGRTELAVFQTAGDRDFAGARGGDQGERTILSILELDASAGEKIALQCALSTSGLMRFSVAHGGETTEMPLLALKGRTDPAAPKPDFPVKGRMREAVRRFASLETSLSDEQKDRLYALTRNVGNIGDEEAAIEILEKLARELEAAL
ncbi:MAG: Hsp70 family protein, partial [Synergistaceae bacterium]|nr:Hsp70 family protein [Synergistaceae bacterium]